MAAFAAACTPAGAPEDTTTIRSATGSTVILTVTDQAGAPLANVDVVALKNNNTIQQSRTTDASGQAAFSLPADSYRFDANLDDEDFYSGAVGHCVTPACTSASISINRVDVTVVDTSSNPVVNETVTWTNTTGATGGFVLTGANGHAFIAMPPGSYRFSVWQNEFEFTSGADGHCTVPGCTAATITTTPPVTVTVRNRSNVPQPNMQVSWTSTLGRTGGWINTDANGVAVLSVPPASVYFSAWIGNAEFVSGSPGHCTIPGCTSASITVNGPVVITVVDTAGTPLSGKTVMWQEEDGSTEGNTNTNASGQATITPPAVPVRFKTFIDGTDWYSSDTFNCTQPGCTSATILVSTQTVVTVVDGSGVAVSGKAVTPTSDEGISAGNKTTNASGQATFRLPFAHWQFKAKCAANNEFFFSGNAGHCFIPGGCATAKIKMPCGQCTNKANGTACDDQTSCTGTSTCQSQKCTGASPMSCTASDQCHAAGACSVETGTCSNPPKANGSSCNDGSACTTGEACQSGACTGGNAVTCTASDQCHTAGTCNPATGTCSNPAKANGTSCNDNNACTQTDTCQSGTCTGGNTVTCTASDQCHVAGSCDPSTGACSNPTLADGASCSDGNNCTGPDTCHSGACTPGANTCAAITVTETVGSNAPHPKLATTFETNATEYVPGDVMSFTAVVTNSGIRLDMSGAIDIANPGTTAFAVAGFQQTLEYQEIPSGNWIPFARAAFDATGAIVPESTLVQIPLVTGTSGGSGATYPSTPIGNNWLTGTSIAGGGNGHWGWETLIVVPHDVVSLIFDPEQSAGVRAVVRVDTPSGQPQSGTYALSYPGETGSANGTTVKALVEGVSINQWVDLVPTSTDPIGPGASRTFAATITAPIPGTTERAANEDEGMYRSRMGQTHFSRYGFSPVINAQGDTSFVIPDAVYPPSCALLFPFFLPTKSGPAMIVAGFSGTFSVGLPNSGDAVASGFTIADSVDGSPVTIGNLSVPGTVAASAAGNATFTLDVPVGRPVGAMTDVVDVTWQDRNGNVYGPMPASFTGATSVGHPEGYLSMSAATADIANMVGVPTSFTVTALDPHGNPAEGVVVHFAVTGLNAQTVDVPTGSDGRATFSYASATIGKDTVVASATITTTSVATSPVNIDWATAVGTPCAGRAAPLDIMMIIDTSSSMVLEPNGVNLGKLEAARDAADRFIDHLTYSRDRIGVFPFRYIAYTDVPLGADPVAAKASVDARINEGIGCAGNFCFTQGSNLEEALRKALDELEGPHHRPEATKVLVYIGDGGIAGSADPTAQIARLHSSGTRGIVLAIGSDIDGKLARTIAGGPNDYFYAPSAASVDFAFNNLNQDLCRNLAPVVSAGGDQGAYNVRIPSKLTLNGEVHDDGADGDRRLTSEWTVVSGPGAVAFDDATSPVTDALFFEPGTYVLQLAATDGYLTVADRATITVDPDPSIVGANIAVALSAPGPLETGQAETLTATLTDGLGAPIRDFAVQITIAGANPTGSTANTTSTVLTDVSGVARFTYRGARAGTDVLKATALGSSFQLDSSTVSVQWIEPTTGGPFLTQGWIASPAHNAKLMERVPIVLSPDVTLASGTITYAPVTHQDQVRTLASNVSGAPGATLATLDTTLLANDTYILQLDGTDQAGNQKTSVVYVDVTGDYKPGRMVVEVTDLTIPLVGLPITIGRRYDSLEKDKVGDFGNGWSLTVGHPRLEVAPHATIVTLTLPNGRRATFGMSLAMTPQQIVAGPLNPFPGVYKVSYDAEPGVFGTMTQEGGCPFVRYNPDSDIPFPCFFNFPVEGYIPEGFVYTDPYGTAYRMGADGSMKSITDRQGNSLTFTANGIISSTGKSVTFARDAQGRITSVAYPDFFGPYHDASDYTYDANGDLTEVLLQGRGGVPFKYTYNQHRLLTTSDPRGNTIRTTTYDTDGRLATDKDGMNFVTSYTYNLTTRTNTTTYPDTGVATQTFDARGLVLSETDPRGHTTTHEYDANRNETKRTNALGEVRTATYDDRGNQTSVTDSIGTTHMAYNDDSRVVTFTDRLGHVATVEYDDRGVPSVLADEAGTTFRYTNSEQGLPLTVEDAAGKRAYVTYDAAGNATSRTDWLGRVTSATYDALGNRLTATTARGGVAIYQYAPSNKLSFTRDAVGHERGFDLDPNNNVVSDYQGGLSVFQRRTNYDYDALNRVKTERRFISGPVEAVTIDYTRDFRGNPLTMTDELGRVTTYEYDSAGNLTKTTFADGTFTRRTYDALNRLAGAIDERGNTTTYTYEAGCGCSDRVTVVTDPLGHATTTAYDANGRRTSVTDANSHTTSFVYDVRDHVIETHYADGTSSSEAYDSRGRRTSTTDQAGATTLYGYDDQGQLTSVTDPLSNVTTYAYDLDGNLASVTDAKGHATTYEYDLVKHETKRTLPLGQFETFAYNVYGDEIAHTDFRGKTTTMTYDISGRMLTKVPDPSLGEASHSYTYTLTGKRLATMDGSGTTTYTYDQRDRVLSKGTAAGTLTYAYDATGNVATLRSSNTNGTSVDYAWDAANQLESITDNRAGGTVTTAYTPTKRPLTVAQPNGIGLTYAYDSLDRATSMLWRHGAAPAFGSWTYTHNERGQRLSATDITGRVATYAYDGGSRLSSETITGDTRGATFNGALSYVLDAAGNRSSRTSTLAALASQSLSYDANDELDSEVYDANGNATSSGGHTFAYDFENRLVSKDGTATVVYDCDGNRVAKNVAGVTTRYLVDDLSPTGYLQVVEEVVGGAVQTRYTYGTRLLGNTRDVSGTPTTSFYGYDAYGNVTFLTDASGAVTDSYDYDAWGNLIASTGTTANSRRYAGEEFDTDLGLINLRARQYRPESGRFVTLDPVMGKPAVPLTFNRYLYATADPINLSDPSGQAIWLGFALDVKAAYERAKATTKKQNDLAYADLQALAFATAPVGAALGQTKSQQGLIATCYALAVVIGKQLDARTDLTAGGVAATFIDAACIIGGGLSIHEIELLLH